MLSSAEQAVTHPEDTWEALVDRALGGGVALWKPRNCARLSNLKVDLLLADAARAAAGGLEVAVWAQQAPAEGAAIGATVGAYKFLRRALPSPIDRAGPLAYYLAGAASERIVKPPAP